MRAGADEYEFAIRNVPRYPFRLRAARGAARRETGVWRS
jgi:hypothetical protein